MRSVLDQYEGQLIRYASRLTGNPDRARDVVQDTFLRLCEKERAKIEPHLAEWLFTVCRNRAFDVQRKESRMSPLTDAQIATTETNDPSPAVTAEKNETANQVSAALESLPANQQEVIRLKFQNGLSYKEISSITKLSASNVGFLIHTGIKTLRHHLVNEPRMGFAATKKA